MTHHHGFTTCYIWVDLYAVGTIRVPPQDLKWVLDGPSGLGVRNCLIGTSQPPGIKNCRRGTKGLVTYFLLASSLRFPIFQARDNEVVTTVGFLLPSPSRGFPAPALLLACGVGGQS